MKTIVSGNTAIFTSALALLFMLSMSLSICACSHDSDEPIQKEEPTPDPNPNPTEDSDSATTTVNGKVLVAYFSCTNTTKGIAEDIADMTGGTLYRIEPETPYTSADLDYNTDCRANREQNNPKARPAIKGSVEKLEDYVIVFLGYPIWWGAAPKVIYTFLEKHNLEGKIIVPFCTSHSSSIGSSDTNLHTLATNAEWEPGKRFGANEAKANIKDWIAGLDLPETGNTDNEWAFNLSSAKNGYAPTVRLSSGYDMPTVGLGTYSLTGDVCVNSVKSAIATGFRKIDTAHMYGNEVEVGKGIRESGVPREDIFVATKIYPTQFGNPEAAIEECLSKLDIGYVDLMLLHHPGTNDVKAYKAMEKYVAEGKIRSIGVSCYYIDEINNFLAQVNIKPVLVQNAQAALNRNEKHDWY